MSKILMNQSHLGRLCQYYFVFNSCCQTESLIEDIIVKVLNNTNNTQHSSSSSSSSLSPSNRSSLEIFPLNSSGENDIKTEPALTLWIDLPNIFPWRKCVQEYNNLLTVLDCDKVSRTFKWRMQTLIPISNKYVKKPIYYIYTQWRHFQGGTGPPNNLGFT